LTHTAAIAYVLCALVSGICATLLMRSWARTRSRLVMWVGVAFTFLAVSNALLVIDLFSSVDLSILRAALIAIGLALLIYGVALEERR
jgi:uncharacterized protein DUF5985